MLTHSVLSGVEASDPWQMSSANQNNRDLSGIYVPEISSRNYSGVSLSLSLSRTLSHVVPYILTFSHLCVHTMAAERTVFESLDPTCTPNCQENPTSNN